MTLTQEEQDILDGKKGDVLAKVMKTASSRQRFWRELGGAPHCSMYFGPPYMSPLIEVLTECVQDKSALTSFSRGPRQLTAACRGRCSGNARRHRIPRCCLVAAGMGLKNVVLQLQELPQHPYWPAGRAALVPTNKDDSY